MGTRLTAAIRESGAKAVIYLPTGSASIGGFLRVGILRARAKVRIVMLALQPRPLGALRETMARALAPDLVLTPSTTLLRHLCRLGLRASFTPMGVDSTRFAPVDDPTKRRLRRKYALQENARIFLHVGHLQTTRNLDWVVKVQETIGAMALVVGGTAVGADPSVARRLTAAGVRVISEYVPNIEEIYQLADAYLFPTVYERAAIGVPLSVLEAMACNLPIVSTPFGGLPWMFRAGDGLFYANNSDDFVKSARNALSLPAESVRTRQKVLPYTWTNVFGMMLEEAMQVATGSPPGASGQSG